MQSKLEMTIILMNDVQDCVEQGLERHGQYAYAKNVLSRVDALYEEGKQRFESWNKYSLGLFNALSAAGSFINSLPGYRQLDQFLITLEESFRGTPANFHKNVCTLRQLVVDYETKHSIDTQQKLSLTQ